MMKKKGKPTRTVSKNVVEPGSELAEELDKRRSKRKISESKSFSSPGKRAAKRYKNEKDSGDEATDDEDVTRQTERPTSIICGVSSLQGERPHMEDTHVNIVNHEINYADNIDKNLSSPLSYFAVYDGHGGVKCAEHLEQHLHTHLFKNPSFLRGRFSQAFYDVFEEIDNEIQAPEWGGSTAACALLTGNVLTVANVGDAEVVVAYEDGYGRLSNVVMSSTLGPDDEGEKRRVAAGNGFVAYGRVNGEVAVSRAFGDRAYKRPSYKTDLISAQPSLVKNIFLSPKDKFILLSCDGLYENDVFNHQKAVDFIVEKQKEKDDPNWIAEQLANEAISRGSLDNVTVIIAFLKWD